MAICTIRLAQSNFHSIQAVQITSMCNSKDNLCNVSFCFSHFIKITSTPLFIGSPTCFCGRRSLHTSFCAPYSSLADVARWTKSDRELFPFVSQLHSVIRSHSKDEAEYKRYFSSLKNSVLTAFYTPQDIVSVLASELGNYGIAPSCFLDPSSGTGVFVDAFQQQSAQQPPAEQQSVEQHPSRTDLSPSPAIRTTQTPPIPTSPKALSYN